MVTNIHVFIFHIFKNVFNALLLDFPRQIDKYCPDHIYINKKKGPKIVLFSSYSYLRDLVEKLV